MGHGVLKVMEGGWQKMAEQGVNFQLNSLAEKNIAKHNNQPTFLPHRRMVCCQELGREDARTCSSKVHQNAEIRGGDCGDDRKSHLAVVKSTFMCHKNNGRGNWCIVQHSAQCTLYIKLSYVIGVCYRLS